MYLSMSADCDVINDVCLQSEWSISVELVVGPDVGISYLTEKASSVCMLNYQTIK